MTTPKEDNDYGTFLSGCMGKVFSFDKIRDALTAQDEGAVDGKIVVKI